VSVPQQTRPPTSTFQSPPSNPPEQKTREEEELFTDFEVVEDDADELEEVQAIDEEELDTLEEVDADDLEDVLPAEVDDILAGSRLLAQREIHIRARKYDIAEKLIDQDLRDYELCLPDGGKRLGRGRENRDAGTQVARLFLNSGWVPKYLEIREGREGELLGVVRRPPLTPGLINVKHTLFIRDCEDRAIGRFERTTWAVLRHKPLWITDPQGKKKILQMKPNLSRWRYLFLTPSDKLLAELVLEEQRIRVHWVSLDASSYYLRFKPALDGRPREKLLCLAVAMGLVM
jgi:hypothetical protein